MHYAIFRDFCITKVSDYIEPARLCALVHELQLSRENVIRIWIESER